MLPRPPIAWRPVGAVAAVVAVALALAINSYGYFRDELYFRILAGHPAWGYVDQPPLTPMVAKVSIALFGDHLWAIRIVPLLTAVAAVVLTAVLARELGGGAGAQVLATVGGASTLTLVSGHVLTTAAVDLDVWLLVVLFAARALLREQPRWWLAVGLTTGVGLYNKELVVLLLIGLGVGLLVGGPRRVLLGPWLWAGIGIALVVGAPNLVYQVANDFPETKMAHALTANKGAENRVLFIPYQLIVLGPLLVPVWIAGWVRLFRAPQWRAVRSLAWAYPVVCLIVIVTGGHFYYASGLQTVLYAAGCVVVARWAGTRLRRTTVASAVVLTAVTSVLIGLPVIPARSLPPAIAAINQIDRDSIGWPTYVSEIAQAYQDLSPADRASAVIVAGNYGEAGAVYRYGPAYGLPAVYSGQNELHRYGPPPESATVLIAVGLTWVPRSGLFGSCTRAGTMDDRVGVDNEEQGRPIDVCRDPRQTWSAMWQRFQHYD